MDGKEWLIFSVFLTPLISEQNEPAPISGLFARWPEKSGIPAAQAGRKDAVRWTDAFPNGLALTLQGASTIEPEDIFLDCAWWNEHQPPPNSSEWWDACMKLVKMRGVANPDLGASHENAPKRSAPGNGAKPEVVVAAIQNPKDLRNSLQKGQSTLEGLSSDELAQKIVGPFIHDHALRQKFKIADSDQEALRGAREALRRLDRAGSSGRSTLREQEDQREAEEARKEGITKDMVEFLEFTSSLGDHPSLLRFFGLLFDIRVEKSKFTGTATDEAEFAVSACLFMEGALLPLDNPRRTVCRLHREGQIQLFTPASRASSSDHLRIANGVFVRAKNGQGPLIHTAQIDLVAGLRAAIAEIDRCKAEPKSPPENRRRLSLLNHGIAAFVADVDLQSGKTTGTTKHAMAGALNRLSNSNAKDLEDLFAEDLLRGIAVEVRNEPGDPWLSLNWRETVFEIDPPPQTHFDKLKKWKWTAKCAEGPLSLELAEARQPISGWLLGPLTSGPFDPQTPASRRPVMLELSDAEIERLHFANPPEKHRKYPVYLLSTVFGIIPVLDGPTERAKDESPKSRREHRVIGDLLEGHFQRHDEYRFGQWIEFTGFMHPQGSYFVATAARPPEQDAAGLAGTLLDVTHDEGTSFVRLEILRSSVGRPDPDAPTGFPPAGEVFLHFSNPDQAEQSATTLREWKETNKAASTPPGSNAFFTGRGARAFIAGTQTEAGSLGFSPNGILLELLTFSSTGPSTFLVLDLPLGAKPQPVTLDLRTIPLGDRHVLGNSQTLVPGARYRVRVERKDDKIVAKEIVEEASPVDVQITGIKFTGSSVTMQLSIGGETVDVSVLPETVVAFIEPVPPPPVQPVSKPPGTEDFSGEDQTPTDTGDDPGSAVRTVGTWAEHGLRVAEGDYCRAFLHFQNDKFRVTRLEILFHDPNTVLLGRANSTGETSYRLTTLGSAANTEMNFEVTDDVTIVAPQAAPGIPWRTVEAPPDGALVKVFLDPISRKATRVEILNSLTGGGRVEEGAGPIHPFLGTPLFEKFRLVPLASALTKSLSAWQPDQPGQPPQQPPLVLLSGTTQTTAAKVAEKIAIRLDDFPSNLLQDTCDLAHALAAGLAANPPQRSFVHGDRLITSDGAAFTLLRALERWERPPIPVLVLGALRDALAQWKAGDPVPRVSLPGLPAMAAQAVAREVADHMENNFPGKLSSVRQLAVALTDALAVGHWSFSWNNEWMTANQAAIRLLRGLQEWEKLRLRLRLATLKEDLHLALPLNLVPPEDFALIPQGICSVALINRTIADPQNPDRDAPDTTEMVARLSLELQASISKSEGAWLIHTASGESGEVLEGDSLFETNRFVQVTLTWSKEGQRPVATAAAPPAVKITGQVHSFDEVERKVQILVLNAPPKEPGITPGDIVGFYLANLWEDWQPVLQALHDSAIPIEFAVDVGVLIEASDGDWAVLKWPSAPTPTKGTAVDGADCRNVTLFPQAGSIYFSKANEKDAQPERVRLVLEPDPNAKNTFRFPLALLRDNVRRDQTQWANLTVDLDAESPALIPDQFLVEDGIFTWFGDSLIVRSEGRPALPAAPARQFDDLPARKFPLKVTPSVPDHSLPELRVGRSYQFRLRAVFLSGTIPRGYCRNFEPDDAIVDFKPFGSYAPSAPNRFLRFDAIAPPRVGWPFNGIGKKIFAPESKEISEVWQGANYLDFKPEAGMPTELLLYSDFRTDKDEEPLKNHDNLQRLINLRPKVLLRPPEATVRQTERFGKFDAWLDANGNNVNKLYSEVIQPRDRVEVQLVTDNPKDKNDPPPPPRQEIAATPGFLLPRIPDPDCDQPVFVLNGQPQPLEPISAVRFRSDKWPAWQDLFLEMRPAREDWTDEHRDKDNQRLGSHPGTENDPIHLYVPRDADWKLEIHSRPLRDSLHRLALYQLIDAGPNGDAKSRAAAKKQIEDGLHPAISPPVVIRIRHLTNRPRQRPTLLDLLSTRPLPGKTETELAGTYELDVPSTGTLVIQAAMENAWIDDVKSALPLLPQKMMRRLIYSEGEPLQKAGADIPDEKGTTPSRILGYSSDAVDPLETSEYTLTELPLVSPASIDPKSESHVKVMWRHDMGDRRHHTVFYRALALSRFRDYFPPGKSQTNPLSGPFDYATAMKMQRHAEDAKIRDPWGWHRVELPATVRPDMPVVREAPPVYQWDPEWKSPGGWENSGGAWTFVRKRTSGSRIWLERPWFSNGAHEKLAVICLRKARVPRRDKTRYLRVISRWGKDPIHEINPDDPSLGLLTLDQVLSAERYTRNLPTLEAAPTRPSSITETGAARDDFELAGNLRVSLAVHTPLFHAQEKAWFCDVFLNAPTYTPFVWLSLARYQPHALEGLSLSRPVHLEHPVQIWPTRTLEIELSKAGGMLRAQVNLSGARSRAGQHSTVCRVERFVSDTELFSNLRPVDDVDELSNRKLLLPVAEGANLWQPVAFLNANGELVHEAELEGAGLRRSAELRIVRKPKWPIDTRMRIAVYESEVHFAAYEFQDSASKALRPIYEDFVELPKELLNAVGNTGVHEKARSRALPAADALHRQ
jgi:hypothetical protein